MSELPVLHPGVDPDDPLMAESRQKAVIVREPFAEGHPAIAIGDATKEEWIKSSLWTDTEWMEMW